MKMNIKLESLEIKSFVTSILNGSEEAKGGFQLVQGDGTFENCHCPTWACNPSYANKSNCCK